MGVIAPSHGRRLEAGILSYGQDMDIENNPFEVRLGWQVDFDKGDYIGKDALARIKAEEVRQRLVGLKVGAEPIVWYNEDFYLVKDGESGADVGYVTSAFWSPSLESNIALAVMPRTHWQRGTRVKVQLPEDGRGRRSGAGAFSSTRRRTSPRRNSRGQDSQPQTVGKAPPRSSALVPHRSAPSSRIVFYPYAACRNSRTRLARHDDVQRVAARRERG